MKVEKIIIFAVTLCFCLNNKVVAQKTIKSKTTTVKKHISEIEQGKSLISKSDCLSCHKPTVKLVGPSFHDIATKYASTADNYTLLTEKIIKGGSGNWGPMAMSPHPNLLAADVKKMVAYILSFK
jgi:cytochrome c